MTEGVIETSGSASRSIMIAIEQSATHEDLNTLIERRNRQSLDGRLWTEVIPQDVYKITKLVHSQMAQLELTADHKNRGEIRDIMFQELKDSIMVRHFPMEALTCPLVDVGLPIRILNPLIKSGMSHLCDLVIKRSREIPEIPQIGKHRAKELEECFRACGLHFLGWPNGPDFLSRDLKFIDFYKKIHPEKNLIV